MADATAMAVTGPALTDMGWQGVERARERRGSSLSLLAFGAFLWLVAGVVAGNWLRRPGGAEPGVLSWAPTGAKAFAGLGLVAAVVVGAPALWPREGGDLSGQMIAANVGPAVAVDLTQSAAAENAVGTGSPERPAALPPPTSARSAAPWAPWWSTPDILVPAAGSARLRLPVGEDAGRLRVSALAVDSRGRLGWAVSHVSVTREIGVEVHLPSQLVAGADVEVPVTAHNLTDSELRATLAMESSSPAVAATGGGATLTLPPGGLASQTFLLRAERAGEARVIATAKTRLSAAQDGDTITVVATSRPPETIQVGRAASVERIDLTTGQGAEPRGSVRVGVFIGLPALMDQAVTTWSSRAPENCDEASAALCLTRLQSRLLREAGAAPLVDAPRPDSLLVRSRQQALSFERAPGLFAADARAEADADTTSRVLLALASSATESIDRPLLERLHAGLSAIQAPDGSFGPSQATRAATLRTTARAVWALGEARLFGRTRSRGLSYLAESLPEPQDSTSLALVGMALAACNYRGSARAQVTAQLRAYLADKVDQAAKEGAAAPWDPQTVATAALACEAVAQSAEFLPDLDKPAGAASLGRVLRGAGEAIVGARQADGTWDAPWTTLFALRAIGITQLLPAVNRGQVIITQEGGPSRRALLDSAANHRGRWLQFGTESAELPERLMIQTSAPIIYHVILDPIPRQ